MHDSWSDVNTHARAVLILLQVLAPADIDSSILRSSIASNTRIEHHAMCTLCAIEWNDRSRLSSDSCRCVHLLVWLCVRRIFQSRYNITAAQSTKSRPLTQKSNDNNSDFKIHLFIIHERFALVIDGIKIPISIYRETWCELTTDNKSKVGVVQTSVLLS